VIFDVYSRKTVGWMLASRESATLAEQLIAATIKAENVPARQLTLHADRGSSMASKPVALLLADLGVTKTHSRPRVSINPYSEAQFKTLKYCPSFPGKFASQQDARRFCRRGLPRLQNPSSPCRPRAPDAERRAQRTSPGRPSTTRPRARRRTHPPQQPLPHTPPATETADQRLDQPTHRERGDSSVIAGINCPTEVDRGSARVLSTSRIAGSPVMASVR